jgi:hypothetical protein
MASYLDDSLEKCLLLVAQMTVYELELLLTEDFGFFAEQVYLLEYLLLEF